MNDNQERNPDWAVGREPLRGTNLSDGVFATVLTLLVLDLRIPGTLSAGNGNMIAIIESVGPHLFSYLLTFFSREPIGSRTIETLTSLINMTATCWHTTCCSCYSSVCSHLVQQQSAP